jgi:glycosyltransferase involved in cell wall biosynthesis
MGKGNVYNVAYTVWETDQLPDKWTALCNLMDEIWVPSTWNKEIFTRCGVTKPIYVVPHVIDVSDMQDARHLSMGFEEDQEEPFLFYSIFQWIERKNPLGLLKAYLTEFKADENVCLALKTYRLNTSAKEQGIIKGDIANLKTSLNLKEYPSIRFFGTLLPAEYIKGLHKRGDCFVLPHRAEGFGIPHAEAMAAGNPVIATRYSGNLEFMNKENSYLIDCQETPVSNMLFPNYHGHMTWSDPCVTHLKKLMRHVYTSSEEAKLKGQIGQQYIKDHLSAEKIGGLIFNRLKEIEAKL